MIVVLLVDPSNYTPADTEDTNPALDPNVIAWTMYPPGLISVNFNNRTWGIKMTTEIAPNWRWSNDPSAVYVAADGSLHLKIVQIEDAWLDNIWQCEDVYLLEPLGYGTYTVQVDSRLDQLDQNTVATPLFVYAALNEELDNRYSGTGGLIPRPYNAEFAAQPDTVSGNFVRWTQPSTAQFTSQIEWRANYATFTVWNGWASTPAPSDIIYQWTYAGACMPPVGQGRAHIGLWLLYGNPPVNGTGNEMVINSFTFQP
jgi:hypothetical protein